jgi:hypothetical protein
MNRPVQRPRGTVISGQKIIAVETTVCSAVSSCSIFPALTCFSTKRASLDRRAFGSGWLSLCLVVTCCPTHPDRSASWLRGWTREMLSTCIDPFTPSPPDHVGLDDSRPTSSSGPAPFLPGISILTSRPFLDVPQSIPWTNQAEDFDGGGESVAYHDSDASNHGNQ